MLKVLGIFLLTIKLIYGYINIYPSFFYKELKKEGTYETFILTNRSDEKIRYRIYFEEKLFPNLNFEVYPKSIILNPYEKKELKVLITPQEKLKFGMYNLTLVIKEIGNPGEKNKKIYSMLKLKLSGYYGNLKLKLNGEVKKIKDKLELNVENQGERLGVFSAYLLNNKDEWVFLDSFILKPGERWEKKYNYDKEYIKIKIQEQDGKDYYFQKLR
ncbi:COG1470 family protein [Cetobacterium sp.]|uniref:COG1470 family protein n=1 Tax=Cetobacterium sp. TaxID=2071632 RepID=UPI003F34F989